MERNSYKIVFSKEEINDILNMYYSGISAPKIAEKYDVSKTKIINTLHDNGTPYRNDRYDEETQKRIFELYEVYQNQRKVAEIIGTTGNSIGRFLRRNGIDTSIAAEKVGQKYTLDEEYFDEINTFNKAYILGLICADGCMTKESTRTMYISLQDTDKIILEKMNEDMGSNRPLKFIDMKSKKESYHNQYMLTITNKHMWHSLYNLGVVPNKSLILKYPDIDSKYNSAFIRGYMDGDGCILKNYPKTSMLGTFDFVNRIRDIVYSELGIYGNIYDTKSNNITKSIEFYGKKEKILLDWLYKDGDFYLPRKKQIYIDRYYNNSLIA